MYVGCSEINIRVLVKHVQHVGFIRVFFSVWGTYYVLQYLGGQKKVLGCALVGGISTQADIMGVVFRASFQGSHKRSETCSSRISIKK